MNIIISSIAWILGVILADLLGPHDAWIWWASAVAMFSVLLAIPLRHSLWGRGCMLALACAACGFARLCAVQPHPASNDIARMTNLPTLQLVGWVTTDPRRTEDGQQLTIAVEAVQAHGRPRQATGTLLVNLPPLPEYHYGQRLRFEGVLEIPRGPDRPGGFDYQAYLRHKGILVLMKNPSVKVLPGQAGIAGLQMLFELRDRSRFALMQMLPEPQAAIAIGILLGLQASIPDDVYATFSATGTSHILVVSGWNFTIVATVLSGLTGRLRLGRMITLVSSLAVLWAYAFFVGATGTVLRAAVMASLGVVAQALERRGEAWRLLAAACWLLSISDPYVLWDLGFQLSALATASLFAYGEPIDQLLKRIPLLSHAWLEWATEALTATLAAQILALPIILYHFGNLSIIAPLANILIVPLVPYTMFLGTAALLLGLAWLPLGQLAALTVWAPLTWMTSCARYLAQLPWAAVQLPSFPLWMLLAYYGLVVGGWWWHVSATLVQGNKSAG